MGKRSKRSLAIEDSKRNKNVKNKKIKREDQCESEETQIEFKQINVPERIKPKSIKNQNTHKKNSVIEEQHENKVKTTESNVETVESITSNKTVISKKKNKVRPQNESAESKETATIKIESVEINDQPNISRKTKDTNLSQEDDVNDEDIDKFCDEIPEEDNVQYENWVKLIEAQLSGNKKKPK